MEELIRTFIDSQRRFFNEIDGRLKRYEVEQRANQFAAFIYSIWNDCYIAGIRELLQFESICSHLIAGNITTAKQLMRIDKTVNVATETENEKRILYTILLNEQNPSRTFQEQCKIKNRQIIAQLITLSNQMPQAKDDLELIASWIVTFPHSDPAMQKKVEESGSIVGSLLKLALAGTAGYITAKVI